jgi:hypothetical protein
MAGILTLHYEPYLSIDEYRHHGDDIPDEQVLAEMIEEADRRPWHYVRMAFADMCIDMAQLQPEHGGQWIDLAEAKLRDAEDTIEDVLEHGVIGEIERKGQVVGGVALRLAELPTWHEAITTGEVTIDYERALEGCVRAYLLAGGDIDGLASKVVEYVPVLLGMRETYHKREGWTGRLALMREDMRFESAYLNWDCGISYNTSGEDFADPLHPIQVRQTKRRRTKQSQNAGISMMAAKHYGFDQPLQVVRSMLEEFGAAHMLGDLGADHEVMPPGQLDEIAALIPIGIENLGDILPRTELILTQ